MQRPTEGASRSTYELPELLRADARRVRFSTPRVFFAGREQREATEAVELSVETSSPLPAMAVSPVLYIGDQTVSRYEPVGPRQYVFTIFEPERFREGSPLSIGWPRDLKSRVRSRFTYAPTDAAGPAVT